MVDKEKLTIPSKILLVDDDRVFRDEFRDTFEEYGIRDASSGEEALEILKRPNEIDLVILDVRMPGINGIEGKIERVKSFLQRNCFKKVNLEDAAGIVYLSPK